MKIMKKYKILSITALLGIGLFEPITANYKKILVFDVHPHFGDMVQRHKKKGKFTSWEKQNGTIITTGRKLNISNDKK
jgi:hypothetical protein